MKWVKRKNVEADMKMEVSFLSLILGKFDKNVKK